MLFPTIEFTIFFITFFSFFHLKNSYNYKILFIFLFNLIFYSFVGITSLIYLLGWSFLIYCYPFIKNNKKITLFVLFAIFQIFFWKVLDLLNLKIDFKTPLGISFFTFQGLTYLFAIEKFPIHKKELHIDNKWNFFEVFAFIGFFPTVFSGPILRAKNFQENILKQSNQFDFQIGLFYLLLGLFYKLTLSSYLNSYTQEAFSTYQQNGSALLLGAYSYTFELFFDFAGYSLISIGLMKLLGFDTNHNFKHPYLSTNIKLFWEKWHISLTSWFRDYLYIYLGGNKTTFIRKNINIFIVMLVSALWHGITMTYIIWGLLHTIAIIINNNFTLKINKYISIFITFNYITLTWIFFRSTDLPFAWNYIINIIQEPFLFEFNNVVIFIIISFFIVLLEFLYLSKAEIFLNKISINPYLITFIFTLFFILVLALSPSGLPPFIYFQY